MSNGRLIDSNNKLEGQHQSFRGLRYFLVTAFVLYLVVLFDKIKAAYGVGSILGFSGSRLLATWPYFLLSLLLAVGLFITNGPKINNFVKLIRNFWRILTSLGLLNWVLFAAPILYFGWFHLVGGLETTFAGIPQIFIFGHLGLLGAIFLSGTKKISPSQSLLITFSIYGLLLWFFHFIPEIHNYPLSYGWSETSRYYYASLFFSPFIYGKWVPLSSLHPTRYVMQSLPFLIPSLPIWFHRLWQVLLWLGITFVAGLALARRIKPANRWIGFAISAWFFLFSFQGPVYYHLMVVVIIVLLGFDKDRLWQSLGLVVLASLWAGISRVNWFPVPGMLAVSLYVLELPHREKSFWQYWRWPVITVVVGLIMAFISQAFYAAISGNPPEVFVSSFNSPLYSYRLFPNEAFGTGIINLMITASFPLLVIIGWRLFSGIRAWNALRLLSLLSILIALLVAGFLVSMKIGGGNNLHNMDSFMVMLGVIAAYFGFNRFIHDRPGQHSNSPMPIPLIIFAVLIPLIFVVDMIGPYPDLDRDRARQDIQQLQSLIDEWVTDDGEVLFIQQRHLLTFNMVKGVELVPEYEKVFLMEMAMSNNEPYLGKFWQDIETHRFDLIVTEPSFLVIRPASDPFAEENNVWVTRVARPLVESYDIILDLNESAMTIMVPKPVQ